MTIDRMGVGQSPRSGGPTQLVIMGPSGCGKSTVGIAIAGLLGVEFIDGDDHHSRTNVEKMRSGRALTDEDRAVWLEELAGILAVAAQVDTQVVLACSALRRAYRDTLRSGVPPRQLAFVELLAPSAVLAERIRGRRHFMPVSLLATQVATLEPLQPDEFGIRLESTGDISMVAATAVAAIQRLRSGSDLPRD